MVTVGDLVAYLDARIPFAWAEPWDGIGLLVGDASVVVERVFVSLDPTDEALGRARKAGCQVLLTHHPAFLEPQERVLSAPGPAGIAYRAAAAGIALVSCHTNLDRSPEGADALPHELGLRIAGPLESGVQRVSLVVTYVPEASADRVRDAMTGAGAGTIGRYTACSFATEGTGAFTPGPEATPTTGASGLAADARERRIEVVCPSERVDGVLRAARMAHPYEEPVITACEGALSRGAARMGRLCETERPMTLRELALDVGERLGVRTTVWGDPERQAGLVAVAPGSGRSLVADALAAGAATFVTGELRYHEAHAAADAGIAVVTAGHDATEWPLTRALAAIAARMPGLSDDDVAIDSVTYPWWTA